MNSVIFEKVAYTNFNSVGAHEVEIDLTKSNQTLITGLNGTGKSTLLGAIVYVLFGKAYNGVPIGTLVNSVNKKRLLVQIVFTVGGHTYTVIRGQKPNVFEIYEDDVIVESEAAKKDYQKYLESILGFDYNTFNHTIGLSKEKYKPFFDLPEGEKRVLVEELLGLTIFSSMNEIVKGEIKADEAKQQSKQNDIRVLEATLRGLENVVEREKENNSEEIKKLSSEIVEKTKELEFQKELLLDITADVENCLVTIESNKKTKEEVNGIKRDVESEKREIDRINKQIAFYTTNSICPTCQQKIDQENEDVAKVLSDYRSNISDRDSTIKSLSRKAINLLAELNTTIDAFFKEKSEEKTKISQSIHTLQREIENLKSRVESLIKSAENSKAVTKDEEAIAKVKSDIEAANKLYDQTVCRIDRYRRYHTLLKDQGVKSKIISSYLPIINKNFNRFLSAMGYGINIMIDSTFKESVVMPGKETFKYKNFSSGQKSRINLALLLTLLVVARERSSVSTNLLFLDEVLENVDIEGVVDLISLFDVEFSDKNIFVVSQRKNDFADLFRHNINFELDDGFTVLSKTNQ